MAADNTTYVARVPIVPDDFANKLQHKDNELVMDFENNDLYVKRDGEYINITGQIREAVKEIQDGSMVLHICTEDTVPAIKDRETNHWYYVVEKVKDYDGGQAVNTDTYIYYGVVDESYDEDKSYLLIAQNMFTGTNTVHMLAQEGYTCCFYVPITIEPYFFNDDTGDAIEYTIVDRLYGLDSTTGSYIAYDIYYLTLTTYGDVNIRIEYDLNIGYTISFDSNVEPDGLVLPDPIIVQEGDVIGLVDDPIWTESRYSFRGWSSSSIGYTAVNVNTYKPEGDMVLFAWFDYNSSTTVAEYSATYISSTSSSLSS